MLGTKLMEDCMKKIFLRNKPIHLTTADVDAMIKKYNFFDKNQNKEGIGIVNKYEKQTINSDEVVLDYTTGLMWQKDGSSERVGYKDAHESIKILNQNCFAGYSDWRLPTLEEAMSLMEPEEKNDLYIDAVFDSNQTWIWTEDLYQNGIHLAWCVMYHVGYCGTINLELSATYVRAVRTKKSSG